MLKSKCILTKPSLQDGIRISIMSRHTLSDGVTPDLRITDNLYSIWCVNLAPPGTLVGAFYKNELTYEQYCKKYKSFLQQLPNINLLSTLAKEALTQNITFLCIERLPIYCHRKALVLECIKYEPSLIYEIN